MTGVLSYIIKAEAGALSAGIASQVDLCTGKTRGRRPELGGGMQSPPQPSPLPSLCPSHNLFCCMQIFGASPLFPHFLIFWATLPSHFILNATTYMCWKEKWNTQGAGPGPQTPSTMGLDCMCYGALNHPLSPSKQVTSPSDMDQVLGTKEH